jgi:hypothetical protein
MFRHAHEGRSDIGFLRSEIATKFVPPGRPTLKRTLKQYTAACLNRYNDNQRDSFSPVRRLTAWNMVLQSSSPIHRVSSAASAKALGKPDESGSMTIHNTIPGPERPG